MLRNDIDEKLLIFEHNEESYQHLDFVWGKDAAEKIYADVIKLFKTEFDF